jgi:transposase InsO family protein
MAYTTNPKMPRVRGDAVILLRKGWSTRKVARYLGYNQSTVARWGMVARTRGYGAIPTRSSRPKRSPQALPRAIVRAIIQKRTAIDRCGQVVHQSLLRDGITVSLSSVQRTLDRSFLLKKRSPWKRPHDATPRPEATFPGALIQVDTIHILAPDGSRIYLYTLIDLFSRWAYAEVVENIGAEVSARFLTHASTKAPFPFVMVQSDHGPEFTTRFTHRLLARGIAHRHSRVRQSNDNAHVERFNRTVQEECLDRTVHSIRGFRIALKKYLPYYNTERLHMGINYQTPQEVMQRC